MVIAYDVEPMTNCEMRNSDAVVVLSASVSFAVRLPVYSTAPVLISARVNVSSTATGWLLTLILSVPFDSAIWLTSSVTPPSSWTVYVNVSWPDQAPSDSNK